MVSAEEIGAARLARVIVQDIALYNVEPLASARGPAAAYEALAEQIDEGRELFRGRVGPSHWPVYEAALATLLEEGGPPAFETSGDARRLAEAMLDDAERAADAADDRLGQLDREVAKARARYRARVDAAWHRTFDRCVSARAHGWLER